MADGDVMGDCVSAGSEAHTIIVGHFRVPEPRKDDDDTSRSQVEPLVMISASQQSSLAIQTNLRVRREIGRGEQGIILRAAEYDRQ